MLVPKFIISKELINSEISMLNDILAQQRQLKQTLVSYLEKISDGLYNAKDEQDSISLISCLKGIQKSFENIKSNIAELVYLKTSLETVDINNVDNSFFDEYNDKYTKLFNKISEDNIFYYSFMESLLKYMKVYFPGTEENVEKVSTTLSQEKPVVEDPKIIINKDTVPNMENTISLSLDDFEDASETKVIETIPDVQNTVILDTTEVKQMFESESQEDSSIISLDFDKKLEKSDESKKKKIEEFKEEIKETEVITPKKEDPTITVQRTEEKPPEKIKRSDESIFKKEPKDKSIIERTLVVSEKNNNVILPYSTEDLEEYFSTNPEKYSSIQDIIDKEYTISLSRYKNQAFSRFKEAYNLAKHKSNLSVVQALSIANECFLNANLDPTIITACKNIEELEIYLGCLEENKLEDFNCFKIVYDLI